MNSITEYFSEFFRLLRTIQLADIADLILVTILVYKGIQLIRTTSTARIAKAVVLILLVTWMTELLNLHVLNYLLGRVMELGLIALVVLFQPELRRAVERVGSASIREVLSPRERNKEINNVISQTVIACEAMSREKIGALMVFERASRLDEYFKTGTVIDGRVSQSRSPRRSDDYSGRPGDSGGLCPASVGQPAAQRGFGYPPPGRRGH